MGIEKILRKMTHREIAGLKGFPVEYTLPEHENKSWLYQKLIYTVNVRVMKESATELIQSLMERPWRSAEHFEVVLGECLSGLIRKHGIDIKNFASEPNDRFEYVFRLPDRTLCVEAKYYSDRQIPTSRIRKICSQLALAAEAGDLVLAKEITQREIYTTEKYLYGTVLRKVAILVSRNGYDKHACQAAKGSLRENGKLILCLTANDLLEMANIKAKGIDEPADFLSKMLDELLIHLEK